MKERLMYDGRSIVVKNSVVAPAADVAGVDEDDGGGGDAAVQSTLLEEGNTQVHSTLNGMIDRVYTLEPCLISFAVQTYKTLSPKSGSAQISSHL